MTIPPPAARAELDRLFASLERQLVESLETARAKFGHPGDKGDTVEQAFRSVLRDYLPRSIGVGHGEVIDTTLRRSAQTDVVIAAEYHPFTYTAEAPGLFFIEGALGAGEVKSMLTSAELDRAIANSRRFKELVPIHSRGTIVQSNPSDLARFYDRRPWFLFAIESQLSIETICEKLEAGSGTDAGTRTDLVDAVFVLATGYVINFGDGAGAFKASSGGANVQGWGCWSGGNVLATFLAWLSAVMPFALRLEPILTHYMLPTK